MLVLLQHYVKWLTEFLQDKIIDLVMGRWRPADAGRLLPLGASLSRSPSLKKGGQGGSNGPDERFSGREAPLSSCLRRGAFRLFKIMPDDYIMALIYRSHAEEFIDGHLRRG